MGRAPAALAQGRAARTPWKGAIALALATRIAGPGARPCRCPVTQPQLETLAYVAWKRGWCLHRWC